jgi:hypothetical protein
MRLSEPLRQALLLLDQKLAGLGAIRLIGGSCGLLLQGVPLAAEPRDLDFYADVQAARAIYSRLEDAVTDRLTENETVIYRSHLARFRLAGVTVELVGGFEVKARDCLYRVEIEDLLLSHCAEAVIDGAQLRLMPLAHELVFNLLRERPDRYEAIADTMRSNPGSYFPAMEAILERNAFGDEVAAEVERLLRFSEWERKLEYESGSSFSAGK